jgi:hypothetical protein
MVIDVHAHAMHVHAAAGLTDAQRQAILGATAAGLLGLDGH